MICPDQLGPAVSRELPDDLERVAYPASDHPTASTGSTMRSGTRPPIRRRSVSRCSRRVRTGPSGSWPAGSTGPSRASASDCTPPRRRPSERAGRGRERRRVLRARRAAPAGASRMTPAEGASRLKSDLLAAPPGSSPGCSSEPPSWWPSWPAMSCAGCRAPRARRRALELGREWYRDVADVGYGDLPRGGPALLPRFPALAGSWARCWGGSEALALVVVSNLAAVAVGDGDAPPRAAPHRGRIPRPPFHVADGDLPVGVRPGVGVLGVPDARGGHRGLHPPGERRWWWAAAVGVVAGLLARPLGLPSTAPKLVEAARGAGAAPGTLLPRVAAWPVPRWARSSTSSSPGSGSTTSGAVQRPGDVPG